MKKKFDFTREVTQVIQALGAKEGGSYGWQIDTPAGLLQISPYEDWVACRFEDVEQAKAMVYYGQLNPYSGKWNWHFARPGPKEVEYFKQQIENLLRQWGMQ